MDLGTLFRKRQDGDIEHYWSLAIGKTWVQAGIWRVIDEKTEVIAEGGVVSWQEDNEESLLSGADSSLSTAATNIERDLPEPTKVVFGLPASWVEDGTILQDKLAVLKKLSKELELSPAGFVVIPEAIVHFLKAKEGAPLNAILVGLSDDTLGVSLVQTGKMFGTVTVSRSMSVGQDVAEGLARLPSVSQYPSRILLYDHKAGSLDEAKQNLIDMEWEEVKVSFLHTPKVEILPEDAVISAVSLAGGAEVGHAKSVVVPTYGDEERVAEEVKDEQSEEKIDLTQEKSLEEVKPEELGFLKGTDIAKRKTVPDQTTQNVASGEPELKHEVSKPVTYTEQEDTFPKVASHLPLASSVGSVFSQVNLGSIFSGRSPKISGPHRGIVGLFASLIVVLLLLLGVLYWYLPKAYVTVYVAPKKLEKTIELTINPDISVVDKANKVIPGKISDTSVSGEKTTSTSGTKTVGERAKGRVTIFHVGGATTLKKGTVLTGSNLLKFTLDEEVKIASGSSLTNPSKIPTTISAQDIGSQYNLASNSEFSVGNFSKADFVAQNESSLSGGTSRSVSAVSEEDVAKLDRDLKQELIQKGLESLRTALSEGEALVEDSAALSTEEKTYNYKVGDEANTLKLVIRGKISALVVPLDSLSVLVTSELEKDVPLGFTLRQDQIEVSYKLKEPKTAQDSKKSTTKEKIQEKTTRSQEFVATLKANFLPKVNPEEIARSIRGKYPASARQYLTSIPGFTRAEISTKFKFPGKLGTLPRLAKNITIEVAAER